MSKIISRLQLFRYESLNEPWFPKWRCSCAFDEVTLSPNVGDTIAIITATGRHYPLARNLTALGMPLFLSYPVTRLTKLRLM
ncbi:hypothetical protein [Providencia huaxiensis]|uniref:hypothetical protein n=1 Tax=Providencia huaxiensis TaxID=2027290 RepID=UPI0034DCE02D